MPAERRRPRAVPIAPALSPASSRRTMPGSVGMFMLLESGQGRQASRRASQASSGCSDEKFPAGRWPGDRRASHLIAMNAQAQVHQLVEVDSTAQHDSQVVQSRYIPERPREQSSLALRGGFDQPPFDDRGAIGQEVASRHHDARIPGETAISNLESAGIRFKR